MESERAAKVTKKKTKTRLKIEKGERIAQIAFIPYIKGIFNEVSELPKTIRGDGGFGSTGTK